MSFTRVQVLQPDGSIEGAALYSLRPAEAVVAAREQADGNWNTWDYPSPEEAGVRPSRVKPGVFFLEGRKGTFFGFPEPNPVKLRDS